MELGGGPLAGRAQFRVSAVCLFLGFRGFTGLSSDTLRSDQAETNGLYQDGNVQ